MLISSRVGHCFTYLNLHIKHHKLNVMQHALWCKCQLVYVLLYIFNLGISFGPIHRCCWTMQVSCHIVKLVLRNNALTTFHGIENLKSLEGLDVSYNIISNFSELEFLGCLPSLRSLWLEGNPLCCARWYRAQVFSFFTHPEKVSHILYIFNFCTFFLLSFIEILYPIVLFGGVIES